MLQIVFIECVLYSTTLQVPTTLVKRTVCLCVECFWLCVWLCGFGMFLVVCLDVCVVWRGRLNLLKHICASKRGKQDTRSLSLTLFHLLTKKKKQDTRSLSHTHAHMVLFTHNLTISKMVYAAHLFCFRACRIRAGPHAFVFSFQGRHLGQFLQLTRHFCSFCRFSHSNLPSTSLVRVC